MVGPTVPTWATEMKGGNISPTSPPSDDDADLASGLARWLTVHRRLTDTRVDDVRRPASGYASETVFAEATWSEDDSERRASLVIRMAPRTAATFVDYDLVSQWQAQMAAAAVGVPVADPVVETDAGWIGVPFIVMPRVDGHIVGSLAHRDPWLRSLTTADRGLVHDGILVAMASIHRADLEACARRSPTGQRRPSSSSGSEYLVVVEPRTPRARLGRGSRLVPPAPSRRRTSVDAAVGRRPAGEHGAR